AAHPETPVRDLASVPEFHDLDAFVAEAARLDQQVHVYQDVAPGNCGADEEALFTRFQGLVRDYAPEVSPVPPASAQSFYEDVLCLASGPDFPHDAHKRPLQLRTLEL